MVYNEENIKYCLLTWDAFTTAHVEHHTKDKDIIITGLYNWAKCFNGNRTFPRFDYEWEKYNIVHLNITSNNLPLISKIKAELPKGCKLLLNVDHALDLWNHTYQYPTLFLQEIDKADFIFAVEPYMAELLSKTLKRNVPCIPHPCEVEKLKKFRVKENRSPRVLVSVHRYDKNWLLPYFAIKDTLPNNWFTCAIGCDAFPNKAVGIYHEVLQQIPFEKLIPIIADSWCALESYTIRSYGRFTIECAALGIPVIGSNSVSSQVKLFPDLTTENNNTTLQSSLLKQLINEPEFHAKCGIYALKAVEKYSLESSKRKMIEFLNQTQ